MSDNNPIRSRSQENKDIFKAHKKVYHIYVEDEGKDIIYKKILEKICFDLDIKYEIYSLGGKINILNKIKSPDTRIQGKKRYIFDKDLDNLLRCEVQKERLAGYYYNELKNNEEVIYLEKYSIENYIIDIDTLYEVIEMYSPPFAGNIVIINYKKKLEEHLRYLYFRLRLINTYYFINENYKLGVEFLISDIYNYKKCRIEAKKYFEKIKNKFLENYSNDELKKIKKMEFLLMTKDEIRGHTIFDLILNKIIKDFSVIKAYKIHVKKEVFFYNCIKNHDFNKGNQFDFIKLKLS